MQKGSRVEFLKMMGWIWSICFVAPMAAFFLFVLFTKLTGTEGWFLNNTDKLKTAGGVAIFAAIVLFFIAQLARPYVGFAQPGHFYEKDAYDARLYVLVFPDENGTKNYYLPANIHHEEGSYSLYRFDWPNGGYEEFDRGQCDDVKLNSKSLCRTSDAKGNDVDYYVQLTKQIAPAR